MRRVSKIRLGGELSIIDQLDSILIQQIKNRASPFRISHSTAIKHW
jgi:hypothetical protein